MTSESYGSVEQRGFDVVERGELIVPCPLVARGVISVSSGGLPVAVAEEVPSVAVHAGVGPTKLLVCWALAEASASADAAPALAAYVIESSATSTNGRDGQWRRELSVSGKGSRCGAQVVEFDGQSWVRLTPSDAFAAADPRFGRLDLHDASDGTDDCWLILGDPVVAGLRPGLGDASWAELIHERYPGYFPALIDETRVDESPADTLGRLDDLLSTHSAARRVAIAYGPASRHSELGVEAGVALERLVAAVLERGRLPVLARQHALGAHASRVADTLNGSIDAIERRHGLIPGPDLAAWFDARPHQLDAEGRPNVEGQRAIQRLWAGALDVWYVPQ